MLQIIKINSDAVRWYLNGKKHRTNGPTVAYSDGHNYWYKKGLKHRTDGPATTYSDGTKFWYLNNRKLSEEDYLKEIANRFEKYK